LNDRQYLKIGEISGFFGLQGWLKIFSFTAPRDNILSYRDWRLEKQGVTENVSVAQGKTQGKSVIARFAGIENRNDAERFIGSSIWIARGQLPDTAAGEYYWADLIGLRVVTENGIELGIVEHLLETGANDVLVVQGDRERLIPFVQGTVVLTIDLANKCMTVAWDPDF
jgi:16S rRNA processing protein RimM